MAIFHLKVKTISRAAGQSVVAAAAYRACARMQDERTGQSADYRRKRGHLAGGLVGWEGSAGDLWNAAEDAEKRKDAKLAREVVVALPAGLPLADQEALVRGFAADLADRHGVAVQFDIHAPDLGGDERNVHAHLLLTTRRVEAGRLGAKTRELDVKQTSAAHLEAWRAAWEARVNDGLALAGGAERIDRRSHARRHFEAGRAGPAPEPAAHLGPTRTALERRGRKTRAGRRNDALAEAARLRRQIEGLDRQLMRMRQAPRPGRTAWHAGRLARQGGRVVVWTAGATAATVLRLAGFRVRHSRLPAWAVAGAIKAAGGMAVAAAQAVRRALVRRRARRAVPSEVMAWWRAVARREPSAKVNTLRAEAYSALSRSHPDRAERAAAMRQAAAALPKGWRIALVCAERDAKAGRLAKVDAQAEAARLAQDAAQAKTVLRAAAALAALATHTGTPTKERRTREVPMVPRRTRFGAAPPPTVEERVAPNRVRQPTNRRPRRGEPEL